MIFVKLASYLPFGWLYFWFRLTAYFGFYISKYRRAVVHENIKNSFPDLGPEERLQLEKRFYFHFMEVFAEFTKSYSFKTSDWEERCRLVNPQILRAHLDKGEPVLLMSGHTANWEWPAHSISSQIGYPMEFLFKEIKKDSYQAIMHKLRTRHGGLPIPKDMALREIIKRKEIPRVIGIIADQIPSIGTEKEWIEFLNQETAFYVGAERIATSVGYPVYFCDTVRVGRGKYEVTFKPIAKPPYEEEPKIIQKYASLLEESIRKNPSDFLWSHKRWKYTKAQAEALIQSN